MSEIELGARALHFRPDGEIEEVDQGLMKVTNMPDLTQQFIERLEEIQDITAYKEALANFQKNSREVAERFPMPEGNVAVVTIHGMGTKIIIGNEAYVPESEVSADLIPAIQRATSIQDVKEIVDNAQSREDRSPDATSIEDSRDENRGNPDNNDMTRAQRAALER